MIVRTLRFHRNLINRYSYGVQFGIKCTALDQSKLTNFVECTINSEITASAKPSTTPYAKR